MSRKSLLLLPLMALALPVAADDVDQDYDDRAYFAPSVLFASPARGSGFDDGWGLNLTIGKPITARGSWELTLSGYDVSANAPGSMTRTGVHLSWLYRYADFERFSPYMIVGGGIVNSRFGGVDDSWHSGHFGLGVLVPATDRVSFRFEGRYQKFRDTAPQHNDWQFHAGLSFPFFERRTPAAPTPAPRFTDPAPAVVAPAAPSRPAPTPSPEPALAPPDFDPVYFALDSATLDSRSRATLDEAIATLRDHPDITLELGGFTCTLGTPEYNLGLSERRAAAVAGYLTARGVARDRLVTRGYGVASPIADNATEEGRRMNRRVELRILD